MSSFTIVLYVGDATVTEGAPAQFVASLSAVSGLNAIRAWFEEIFKAFPKGSPLDLKQTIIRDNVAYIVWTGESPFVSIPFGTDTCYRRRQDNIPGTGGSYYSKAIVQRIFFVKTISPRFNYFN